MDKKQKMIIATVSVVAVICEGDTCQGTCSTCSTCQGQGYTCDQTSCQYTCESTCGVSCGGTCSSTCEQSPTCGASTCDYDCPVSVYVCN